MEHIFNDKLLKPNVETIYSITGYTELLWKQTFSHLFDHSKDLQNFVCDVNFATSKRKNLRVVNLTKTC